MGLICSFLNMALSSAGFVLQRKAHLMTERNYQSFQPLWLLGVILYIAAALPDIIAYALLPQVLCATIACFRVVVVCMLGHVFLGEHLGRGEAHNIGICTLGTILCVLFGPGDDDSLAVGPGDLKHPNVAVYSALGLLALGVFFVIAHGDSLGWLSCDSKLYRFSLPFATALAYGVEKVFNTELGFVHKPKNIFEHPLWLTMAGMVALLGIADFYLNVRAAKRMPLFIFVPLSFAFSTSLQCLQAMVVFEEFTGMTPLDCSLTWLGVTLSLAGALRIQPPHLDAREVEISEVQLMTRIRSEAPITGDAEKVRNCAPPMDESSGVVRETSDEDSPPAENSTNAGGDNDEESPPMAAPSCVVAGNDEDHNDEESPPMAAPSGVVAGNDEEEVVQPTSEV